jgi:hypothetical protein
MDVLSPLHVLSPPFRSVSEDSVGWRSPRCRFGLVWLVSHAREGLANVADTDNGHLLRPVAHRAGSLVKPPPTVAFIPTSLVLRLVSVYSIRYD